MAFRLAAMFSAVIILNFAELLKSGLQWDKGEMDDLGREAEVKSRDLLRVPSKVTGPFYPVIRKSQKTHY